MADKFDMFTEGSRNLLKTAQDQAIHFNSHQIETEHLLLGLILNRDVSINGIFHDLKVDSDQILSRIFAIPGIKREEYRDEIHLSPDSKQIIELAVDEARRLGHDHVGTEHFLLGIIRQYEGSAAKVLKGFGIDLIAARVAVVEVSAR